MITIIAVLKALDGKEKELEKAFREMIRKVQDEEGTLSYILHRAQDDPGKFMFYEKYRDIEALQYHTQTPYMKEFSTQLNSLLAEKPSIDMYEELEAIQ